MLCVSVHFGMTIAILPLLSSSLRERYLVSSTSCFLANINKDRVHLGKWGCRLPLKHYVPDNTTVRTLDLSLYTLRFGVYKGSGDCLCHVSRTDCSEDPLFKINLVMVDRSSRGKLKPSSPMFKVLE